MPFDPTAFEAQIALKLIPTERLPSVALDALEAGFEGPHVLRMAILDPTALWEIDRALPPMLQELGCGTLPPEAAALRLARQRAQHLLKTDADPLPSLPYFNRLMEASGYIDELLDLGYFDDEDIFHSDDPEELRRLAREALRELLSPELRQQRLAERRAAWEQEQARLKTEWPYVLNSPTGRTLLKARYLEKLTELRPLLWIAAVAWALLGWAFGSWRIAIIGLIVYVPLLAILPLPGEYLRLKRERRDTLLRRRVPEELI